MRASRAVLILTVVSIASGWVGGAEFQWNEPMVADQVWQSDANWDAAGFPDSPADSADLAVGLVSDLNISLGGSEVAVGRLTMGGTAAPVATTIGDGVLRIQSNSGNAVVTSTGVPGSVNTVTASLFTVNERIQFSGSSTNDITLGDFSYSGQETSLRSFMPPGVKASINNVVIEDPSVGEGQNPVLFLNDDPDNQGTLEIRGVIEGSGGLSIGPSNAQVAIPLSTVILSGDNTFTGRVNASRVNIVLASDNALGQGDYRQGQQSNQFGANLLSDDDARKISIPMQMSQWQTVRGQHSLEWAGDVAPTNSRGFVNLLPAGKQLTLSGNVFAAEEADNLNRRFRFDGTGTTVVTGGLHAFREQENMGFRGGHHKNGTGVLLVSGPSTYDGETVVSAGTLRFANTEAFGQTDSIRITGGAAGVDTGTFTDFDFMFLLDPASTGGLIVAPSEADDDIDFEAAGVSLASLAGPETGVEYTGTITPAADTYRLGGGAGSITLPQDNQLTGTRSLVATNGGVVRLSGQNDYTGPTRVEGNYATSFQEQARANERNGTSDQIYVPTTLAVQHLNDGSSDSSIGRSPADAANLIIQGGSLRYEGEGGTTNRLFTIGTAGATLDASGSGPIEFTNTSTAQLMTAESREGSIRGISIDNGRIKLAVDHTDQLVIGMGIEGLNNIPENTTIRKILDEETVEMSQPVPDNPFLFESGTVSFSNVDRTLLLTGSNTERNTLRPKLSDTEDSASLRVRKSGMGTWVLAGANDYSGSTTVEEGTMLVDDQHVGGGGFIVLADGVLGGSGTISDDISVAGSLLASGTPLTVDGVVTLEDGGALLVDLAALSPTTPLLQFDDFDVSTSNDHLRVLSSSSASPGDYLLATYEGSLAGEVDHLAAGIELNYDTPGQIVLSVLDGGLRGDFDGNGVVDLQDIDLLTPAIASGNNDASFDLNGDSLLDTAELDLFLSDGIISAGNRLRGDADFDGDVAFADFLRLSGKFGQAGTWSDGDFDANGTIEFADFLMLSGNFGSVAAGVASVPESAAGGIWLLALLLWAKSYILIRRSEPNALASGVSRQRCP